MKKNVLFTITFIALLLFLPSVSMAYFYPSNDEERKCAAWSDLSEYTRNYFNAEKVCPLPIKEREEYYRAARAAYIKRLNEDSRAARTGYAVGFYFTTLPLDLAVKVHDVDLARIILRHGADVNFRGPFINSETALVEAVREEDVDMVRLLLENGAEIDFGEDDPCASPILVAIRSGNAEVLKALLDFGADPKLGMEALPFWGRKAMRELADLLISRGAQEDIWAAASIDDTLMLDKLIGINQSLINTAKNEGGRRPLHAAAQHGALLAIKFLAEHGADLNTRDGQSYTPLHFAIYSGQPEAALLLISLGARTDIGAQIWFDSKEIRPIETACLMAEPTVVKALVDKGEPISGEQGAGCVVEAARTCQVDLIKYLLEKGASPNGVDRFGTMAERHGDTVELKGAYDPHATPLQLVLEGRNSSDDCVQVAELLLDHGADINKSSREGLTLLTEASAKDNLPIVRVLLEHGADPKRKGDDQAICAAASSGSPELLMTLITNGADINLDCGEGTPLDQVYYPYNYYHTDWRKKADILMLRGAKRAKGWTDRDTFSHVLVDPDEALTVTYFVRTNDPEGLMAMASGDPGFIDFHPQEYHPLDEAARNCQKVIVETLLALGAPVNEKDNIVEETPLHRAAECDVEIGRILIDHGADVNAWDKSGRSVLMNAIKEGNLPLVRLLLERGANPNYADHNGQTALHYATGWSDAEAIRLLLKAGAEVNARNSNGATPLHYTAQRWRHPELTLILLEAKADVTLLDNSGSSPLWYAIGSGNQTSIRYLWQKGAIYGLPEMAANNDINALTRALKKNPELINFIDKDNDTLLHTAASFGQDEMVKFLVERGLDVNASGGKYQRTPLFYAVVSGYETTIKLLLKLGAQIDARDVNGDTPLLYSSHHRNTNTCVLLERSGADEKAVNNKGERVYGCFPEM